MHVTSSSSLGEYPCEMGGSAEVCKPDNANVTDIHVKGRVKLGRHDLKALKKFDAAAVACIDRGAKNISRNKARLANANRIEGVWCKDACGFFRTQIVPNKAEIDLHIQVPRSEYKRWATLARTCYQRAELELGALQVDVY